MTKITETIGFMQCCRPEDKPALEAIHAVDSGCIKLDDEFANRAADLILGAEADQFEELVRALAGFCGTYAADVGDDAYAQAAQHLFKAATALRGRMGN
jgi:hypothetical protein